MRRFSSPLAAALSAFSRWRERAGAPAGEMESEAAFETWLVNSGLQSHTTLSSSAPEADGRQQRKDKAESSWV